MRNLLKNRTALSTVVTTLIILVVSVLLAGVVTYFAINVTSTRVQEENIILTKQHVWFDVTNQTAEAAILVVNTGGRDVVFSKVSVRGQPCGWANVFYNITNAAITSDLPYNTTLTSGIITIDGNPYTLTTGSTPITLKSGYSMILYLGKPDSISVNDVGLTVAMTIFSSQAMYYKETNVEAVS
jgi:hypothetical protein